MADRLFDDTPPEEVMYEDQEPRGLLLAAAALVTAGITVLMMLVHWLC